MNALKIGNLSKKHEKQQHQNNSKEIRWDGEGKKKDRQLKRKEDCCFGLGYERKKMGLDSTED